MQNYCRTFPIFIQENFFYYYYYRYKRKIAIELNLRLKQFSVFLQGARDGDEEAI